uniref:Ig-like domain-containing protein n=1 Tax=Amphilophus citrinellus TaxID=61819 RepID=A0A3Q0R0Y0_AMPCI
ALLPDHQLSLSLSWSFMCKQRAHKENTKYQKAIQVSIESIRKEVHWYKQSAGDTLKVIWTARGSETPEFAPEFNNSRWRPGIFVLYITKTQQSDTGAYFCMKIGRQDLKFLKGTFLKVEAGKHGNTQTSKYTVVQEKTVPSGDSMSLQCSLLAESDNKSCPGGHRVFWFREGTHTSHPRIIYSDLNRHHECEKRSESQQSCVFHFSKNIDFSDAGTYHCAVATCGEILFGNGTTLAIQGNLIIDLLIKQYVSNYSFCN